METRARYMLVGIFVLLSLGGILGFFLWLAKKDSDYNVNYYTTYFPGSVTGLSVGGPVNFLGVPVGTIKNIKLNPRNLEVVDITIAITNTIPIKEDAYASLELQGLTGYKFVQIYGGSSTSPLLKKKPGQQYPVIPARYSGVEEIMTLLPRMMGKLTNLVDRVNTIFSEENRDHFSETLKSVNTLSKHLADSSKPLSSLVKNTDTAVQTFERQINSFGTSTKITFQKVDKIADNISQYLEQNRASLNTLTQNGSFELLKTLASMNETLEKATRVLKKLEKGPREFFFEGDRPGIFVTY